MVCSIYLAEAADFQLPVVPDIDRELQLASLLHAIGLEAVVDAAVIRN